MKMKMKKKEKINEEILDELEDKDKELEKLKNRIRKRNSYKKNKEILEWLNEQKRTPKEILWKIHKTIDDMGGYKYRQTSNWAGESLLLLMEDVKMKSKSQED